MLALVPSPDEFTLPAIAQLLSSPITPPPFQPSSPAPPRTEDSPAQWRPMAVGIAVGCSVVIFVLIILFAFWKKMKKKSSEPEFGAGKGDSRRRDDPHRRSDLAITIQSSSAAISAVNGDSGLSTPNSEAPFLALSPNISFQRTSTFTYEELQRATGGFSEANLLGQGGFGYVHKGVLPNGTEIAVKQLKAGSGQGEREFQAEVETITRADHKHLVSLLGYCLSGSWRMLVYEFVPNNNLEFHLHGDKATPVMNWSTRLRIALGAAKGLAYLHEECNPKIIHRDIKASNILLDLDFEAKVADFGLAKLFDSDQTHVSTRVMGTFGYLAPEYAFSGKLTEKSDVYSFGVLLLQLITGRPTFRKNKATSNTECLVDWAKPLLAQALESGNFDAIIDQHMHEDHNRSKEMERMAACAAACVFHSAKQRPKMSQVVRALEGDTSMLLDVGKEQLLRQQRSSAYISDSRSSEYNTAQYNQDMAMFRKTALESEDYSHCSSSSSGGGHGNSKGQPGSRHLGTLTEKVQTGD
ncbi:proline-rich receptor-like protein kinase PERK1 [Andrographis paniculata]|uniref:proline-rich receptor-like protein kinase PERK1 n=1 Tax=Andrographis paniculata TaxID=175694 RepID=UPI0021E8320E|nr:proline-rich receptor-like protein kinase PERK1 [Andrographis paniculata]